MNLYLLNAGAETVRLCEEATHGWRIDLRPVDDVAELPTAEFDREQAILLIDGEYARSNGEQVQRLLSQSFFRIAVICWDPDASSLSGTLLGQDVDSLTVGDPADLKWRIGDWLGLHTEREKSRVQSQQLQGIAESLETSSQDVSGFRDKISFLDRQRRKLASVLETMNMLTRLSQEINCLDLDEIITICVTKIPLMVGARYASLYLYHHKNDTLELKRHNHGYRIDDLVRVTKDTKSAMAMALQRRKVMVIRDFDEYERLHDVTVERPNARKSSSCSSIIAPLVAGDRVVAVLNLADKRTGEFFDEVNDLPPIEQMSIVVGSAIRNWQLFQEVRIRAKTDAMTEFINHQTFFEELEKEVLRVRRYEGTLSVLMLDVDNFKLINDVHGHQIGDHILAEVARIIKLNIRDTDAPARYGGDEFAVILAEADVDRARLVAERIREMVEAQTFTYEDRKLSVSMSIGAAQYRPGLSVADFVNEADKALYDAKAKGRNRVETATLA